MMGAWNLILICAIVRASELEEQIFDKLSEEESQAPVTPIRVKPAQLKKLNYRVDEFGRVSEVEKQALPDDDLENSTSFNCKYHDPCAGRYHAERTYYPAYRPSIFILCYKYDFCLELGCPINNFWNATTNECKSAEEGQEAPEYEIEEEEFKEHVPRRTQYDMTPYDCKRKYPCSYDSYFSPKAAFRHVDSDKFIVCNFWTCEVLSCPEDTRWFQDVHKCLVPLAYERSRTLQDGATPFQVTEEADNSTKLSNDTRGGSRRNGSETDGNPITKHEPDLLDESTTTTWNDSDFSSLENLKKASTMASIRSEPEKQHSKKDFLIGKPSTRMKNKQRLLKKSMLHLKKELDKERGDLEKKLVKMHENS